MRVSAVGGTAHSDMECLEDTGSTNFTLYEEDLANIGVDAQYMFWMPDTTVDVIGGPLLLRAYPGTPSAKPRSGERGSGWYVLCQPRGILLPASNLC